MAAKVLARPGDRSLKLKKVNPMIEENPSWHDRTVEETSRGLRSPEEGLTDSNVEKRSREYGKNVLPGIKGKHPIRRFLEQFNNVFIYVLMISGMITAVLGHYLDSGIIFAVVIINGTIGFVQEGKAERALDSVRNMLSVHAIVLRDGTKRQIDASELVPGDRVHLRSGDKIPADLRLIEVHELNVDESSLTGESEPVNKTTKTQKKNIMLGDRKNMAFSGTLVTSGRGLGVVTATGMRTEIGKINRMLGDVRSLKTPLIIKVDRFAKVLSVIILIIAALTFAIGHLVRNMPLSDLLMAIIGLSVAAIPEGLPAIITITLAIGVQRMARRNTIVRRLPGVETLGSVTVICSDKTGTLTRGEMTVTQVAVAEGVFNVEGTGYDPDGRISIEGKRPLSMDRMILGGILCNDSRLVNKDGVFSIEGSPTEGALLTLAAKAGIERPPYERLDVIPFESEHKYMATLHDIDGKRILYLKGAYESLLDMSEHQLHGEEEPLDRDYWESRAERMASDGRRLLGSAWREWPADRKLSHDNISNLCFIGIFGMLDPPRQEAIEAIRECREAGIRVKMITGDHLLTAKAIGKQLGIEGEAITGDELTDENIAEKAQSIDIFARVSPEHKLKLVEALQKQGEITAMTGDGVNDAPALKRSNIGIAMGIKGTEAAKEASEMVIADDNFASIVHAVEEGRTVYDNLKKALLFILPTNGGEGMVIIASIFLGLVLPMTAAQVLWVNMVTAVSLGLTLSMEPMEKNTMKRPPRRSDEPLITIPMLIKIIYVSLLLMGVTLAVFMWMKSNGASSELARTAAVNALVMGELAFLFNARSKGSSISIKGLKATPYTWGAVAFVVVLQLLFTYAPPMQGIFMTQGLDMATWGIIALCGSEIFLLVEIEKEILNRSKIFK
ncbi:MAG: cation-transporting P-type ATPase [Candidatus Thermoplasmatota archaeon]|nr:cation-transporting P-type ATPase [Candidatus Thermoplasmatota archaeon]